MKLFFRLQVGVATILLIFCLATNKVSSTIPGVSGGNAEEECPPCEMLFSKLERTGKNGKLAQDVRVQERGEPKSGTGVLYFWTTASLLKTRDYLRGLFGERNAALTRGAQKTMTKRSHSCHHVEYDNDLYIPRGLDFFVELECMSWF